jgi:hypothetical protein
VHLLLNTAGFLGLGVGFYIGAWARVRCKTPWMKAIFIFAGAIAGFLAAFLVGFIVVMVVANTSGVIDYSTGTIDVAAARALALPLGARKIEYLTHATIGTLLGLLTAFG